MRPIPLAIQTIYADLLQSVALADAARPGSISTKTVRGETYLYSIERDGNTRPQRYIGPAKDPAAQQAAAAVRRAAAQAKDRRKVIAAIKAAHVPAPNIYTGRVLDVMANAGLFQAGAVLVGTVAYQMYPCLVGAYLPAGALTTNDADIALTQLAIRSLRSDEHLDTILRRADATFEPKLSRTHPEACVVFEAENSFKVEVLTTLRRKSGAVHIPTLGCAAQPLPFLEYLLEETIPAVALYGSGVLVHVPDPVRFALHKIIVSARRAAAKTEKDTQQAAALIQILANTRQLDLAEAIGALRKRGPSWRAEFDAGVAKLPDDARSNLELARRRRTPPTAAGL
jgi:hypothetical protein